MSFLEITMGFCPMKRDYFLKRWQSIFISAIFFCFDIEHRLRIIFFSLIAARKHIKFGKPPWGGCTGAARGRAAASSIARKLLPCPLPRGWGRGDKPPQICRMSIVAPLGAEGSEIFERGDK